MNRITATLTATIAVIGFSACTAQQRQMVDNIIEDEAPAEVVVDTQPAVVTPPPRNEATVTTYVVDIGTPLAPVLNPNAPCGETGAADCYQPPSPPTTVYTGPPLMQCEDGSFAEQGQCPPPVEQGPPVTNPEFMQCEDGLQPYGTCQHP